MRERARRYVRNAAQIAARPNVSGARKGTLPCQTDLIWSASMAKL